MVVEEKMEEDMTEDGRMSDMLTVREVARLLHVHPNTLRRWSNDGRIKACRINRRGDRRFKCEEIARFLAELNGRQNGVNPIFRPLICASGKSGPK
jgi:excisionase family DNA binding protein